MHVNYLNYKTILRFKSTKANNTFKDLNETTLIKH